MYDNICEYDNIYMYEYFFFSISFSFSEFFFCDILLIRGFPTAFKSRVTQTEVVISVGWLTSESRQRTYRKLQPTENCTPFVVFYLTNICLTYFRWYILQSSISVSLPYSGYTDGGRYRRWLTDFYIRRCPHTKFSSMGLTLESGCFHVTEVAP